MIIYNYNLNNDDKINNIHDNNIHDNSNNGDNNHLNEQWVTIKAGKV